MCMIKAGYKIVSFSLLQIHKESFGLFHNHNPLNLDSSD